MTRPPQDFSDTDLTAYLDGEAPEELRKEIDAALADDPAVVTRLEGLMLPMDQISAAMDALAAAAPPAPALQAPTPPRRTRLWTAATFATGLAAGLAIAIFTGLGTPPPAAPGWKAVVASYHSLYGAETLTVQTPASELTAQLTRASAAIGKDLTGIPAAQGLDLRRAQVLEFNGKTLIQLAFLRADGVPVALCIIASGPEDTAPQAEMLQGMASTSWRADGFAYLLIGGTDADALPTGTYQAWSDEA